MKSKDEKTVVDVAIALIYDASDACAMSKLDVVRDIERIRLCYHARGLTFFTLDLPSLDEVLLQTLENGRLPGSSFLTKNRSRTDLRPRFLYGLWSHVIDSHGCLLQDADPNAIFFLRQIFCFCKKLRVACSANRTENARRQYHAIESELLPPALRWQEDAIDLDRRCSFTDSFDPRRLSERDMFNVVSEERTIRPVLRDLDFVAGLLASELGYFSPVEEGGSLVDEYRHGPGSVSDADCRAFKYDFPHWDAKLDASFPYDWCGNASIIPDTWPSCHEPPSKLIAVPKTAKAPRLIASEPVSHQWCQQWIKNEIVERSRHSIIGKFISFDDQTLSQRLVESSSQTRSLATLDLSSASDRVSCRHVEALFGANASLLRLCHAARTRWVVDNLSTTREFLQLKKFAAMGSALTFPVQSIFFLACALASLGCRSKKDVLSWVGKVRVFGDDIIVPNQAYAQLTSLLTHLGLVVNSQKSFTSGYFRESCGKDAYKGYDVTPVKPKTLLCKDPESYQAMVDTSNNLHKAGCWRAAAYILSRTNYRSFRPVVVPIGKGLPGAESFSPNVVVPCRWNSDLQVNQAFLPVLRSKTRKIRQDVSAALLQFYTEKPYRFSRTWASGTVRRASAVIAYARVDLQ